MYTASPPASPEILVHHPQNFRAVLLRHAEVGARRDTPAPLCLAFIPQLMAPGIAEVGANDDSSFEGNIFDAASQKNNKDFYFQTAKYGWNAGTGVSILTNFEEIVVINCILPSGPATPGYAWTTATLTLRE